MKVAQQLELVRTRLGIDSSAWLVEDADRTRADQAAGLQRPRYVWVPTRDTLGPPERVGGNPRQLLTRFAGLELHLWTETQDEAETLLNAVIVAWLAEANTSVAFTAINWQAGSAIGRGFLATLELRVKVPIVAATKPVAQATTIAPDTTGIVHGDGNLDSGETT